VALAARTDQPRFAGLILESTFTNIQSMVSNTRFSGIPGLDMLVTQPFDSIASIHDVQSPILFLHGTDDTVVPHAMSDLLFDAASKRPAGSRQWLVKIEGASHSGASRSGAAYENAIKDFTDQNQLAASPAAK
jgi:fermentation-respiration switch protein FrsA (DUF1100 family)